MRSPLFILPCVVAIPGCADGETTAPAQQRPPATVAKEKTPPPPHRSELVAASPERGLSEYYFSGQLRTTLSDTPAAHPVLTADDSKVYFLGVEDRSLRRFRFRDRNETVVATLPDITALPEAQQCRVGEIPPRQAQVRAWADVRLSNTETAASVTLREPCKGREVEVRLVVDLESGAVQAQESTTENPCQVPEAPPVVGAGPYRVEKGHLYQISTDGMATSLLQVGDPAGERELSSPSGKWQLFSDPIGTGGHGHRSLFMLDTEHGDIYSLAPGRWRPAIARGNLLHLRDVETLSVVGSSSVRWLPGRDILAVDTIVVIPGAHIGDLGYITARPPTAALP